MEFNRYRSPLMLQRSNAAAGKRRWCAILFSVLIPLATVQQAAGDTGIEGLRATGKAFSSVAKQASPSVVFIQVEGDAEAPRDEPNGGGWPFQDDLFRRFFGDDFPGLPRRPPARQPSPQIGQGSGFVFASGKDGSYILTNSHVVREAARIRVRLRDGREFDARLKATDPKSDIAVLEIAARDLPALKWADSALLEVGEWVVALGNPFGLSHTLTVGVVSATGRTSLGINDYEDFIQTDAAINPGNSGGPLLNLDGEVVGMNTAIFSQSGGHLGVGFAIPSNLARAIAEQIVNNGSVVRGYIGLAVQPIDPDLADALRIESNQGVLVNQVFPGSPAEQAGIRPGDVLTHFDGLPLADGGHYRNLAAQAKPDSEVALNLLRDGRRLQFTVQAGRIDEAAVQRTEAARAIGLGVRPLNEQESRQLRGIRAVLVTGVARGSLAALANIRPGTLILEVNRKPVGNPEEFTAALGDSDGSVMLRLLDNGGNRTVTLRWR